MEPQILSESLVLSEALEAIKAHFLLLLLLEQELLDPLLLLLEQEHHHRGLMIPIYLSAYLKYIKYSNCSITIFIFTDVVLSIIFIQ